MSLRCLDYCFIYTVEIIEIDDFITLKLFDKAIKEINQLKGYDFHKYKAKLYMEKSYFEESVSHAIEMWKFSDNLFQKLEYYLFRALISHQFHFSIAPFSVLFQL